MLFLAQLNQEFGHHSMRTTFFTVMKSNLVYVCKFAIKIIDKHIIGIIIIMKNHYMQKTSTVACCSLYQKNRVALQFYFLLLRNVRCVYFGFKLWFYHNTECNLSIFSLCIILWDYFYKVSNMKSKTIKSSHLRTCREQMLGVSAQETD